MWLKWFLWRFIVRHLARKQGFIDPTSVLAQFQNFAQPSDVLAPQELLKEGLIFHARGLMNSQAIQHNLDWVWPFWVERQFDPHDQAFVPRAFSLTQINLTHRNWTAVGIPNVDELPIIDPRGLVTPFYDGWSLDAWIWTPEPAHTLIPSRLDQVAQEFSLEDKLAVITKSQSGPLSLTSTVEMMGDKRAMACQIKLSGLSRVFHVPSWLVVSLRPYNPEGVSFVHDVELLDTGQGWKVNGHDLVYFNQVADRQRFSYYRHGDVFKYLLSGTADEKKVYCKVGMCTAAAMFELKPDHEREVTVQVPYKQGHSSKSYVFLSPDVTAWSRSLNGYCGLKVPDKLYQSLYDQALRTLILHSPKDVYPGPYTYRRFWFRDAAFILYALLCAGLSRRVEKSLDTFPARQKQSGYFHSQDGEWDSNGEALWIIRRFCEMTQTSPSEQVLASIDKGGLWISRKRLAVEPFSAHAGLFPPGFSAEHLGPNDYYYWDNFWGIAGLQAAAYLEGSYGSKERAEHFAGESKNYLECVELSLLQAEKRLGTKSMPAAPYRRLDSGAIGSLAAGYPLQLFGPQDSRLLESVNYLLKDCSFENGFFHDMTHSGINPYLTLHIAQVLLRAGDIRFVDLMDAVAVLASPTGQWPEAIHPRTKGGCMGDGQHVWAAAEWVLMVRNCFVREEGDSLILCEGLLSRWLEGRSEISFGPAPTRFGTIMITVKPVYEHVTIVWTAKWFGREPDIEFCIPGFPKTKVPRGQNSVMIRAEGKS